MPLVNGIAELLPDYARLDLAAPFWSSDPGLVSLTQFTHKPASGYLEVLLEVRVTLVTDATVAARSMVLVYADENDTDRANAAAGGTTAAAATETYAWSDAVGSGFTNGTAHMGPVPVMALLPGWSATVAIVNYGSADKLRSPLFYGLRVPTGPARPLTTVPAFPTPLLV